MIKSESNEMYLEVIFDLSQDGKEVRTTDIAKKLSCSKPSVSKAISKLKDQYLVIQERYGTISLTDKGLSVAKEVRRKHDLISEFLMKSLNITPDIADQNACRMEHFVSDEVVAAIATYLKKI